MYQRPRSRSLGFAFLPVLVGAIDLGKRLLATGSSAEGGVCTRPVEAFKYLLANITPAERADWIAYVRPLEARPTDWSGKIMGNDAAGLAFEYSGGDDCRTTSTNGKLIVAYTADLLGKVESRVPDQPDYNLPGIDVTVPRGTANAGIGALFVGGLVLWALSGKKGRR